MKRLFCGLRDKLIRLLGGITYEDAEIQRTKYESWAVVHLVGKEGRVTPNAYIYVPFYGDKITVIRSNLQIMNGAVKNIEIAPWCKNVAVSNVSIV